MSKIESDLYKKYTVNKSKAIKYFILSLIFGILVFLISTEVSQMFFNAELIYRKALYYITLTFLLLFIIFFPLSILKFLEARDIKMKIEDLDEDILDDFANAFVWIIIFAILIFLKIIL